MALTDEQKQQVVTWIGEGKGLPEVQNLIGSEFEINMTFMEVRFLVDDLDLELQEASAPEPEKTPEAKGPAPTSSMPDTPSEGGEAILTDDPAPAGGAVSITLDKIQRPGAVVSGNVTFSDGVSAGWQIDQMGRLGLIPTQEDYQPSQEDLAEFQLALQQELQKKGF